MTNFCDDHIFKINNTFYCEKHRSSGQDGHQTSSNPVFNQNKLSKLNHEGDLSYDRGFYKEAIKLYDDALGDTHNAKDWNKKYKKCNDSTGAHTKTMQDMPD